MACVRNLTSLSLSLLLCEKVIIIALGVILWIKWANVSNTPRTGVGAWNVNFPLPLWKLMRSDSLSELNLNESMSQWEKLYLEFCWFRWPKRQYSPKQSIELIPSNKIRMFFLFPCNALMVGINLGECSVSSVWEGSVTPELDQCLELVGAQ